MMANEQHAAIDDDNDGSVDNNDTIRSSANIMTEKLYLTVMDVYESYADTIKNKENDEYNKMVANLEKKRMHMPPTSPVNKTDDTRGVITKRILEGWTIHTGTCNKCAMPLMEHNGDVSCVLCQRIDDSSAESKSNIDTTVLSLASTSASASDSDVDDKENLVDKKLSQFRDQRSKANEVYTAKILGGYTMHDELCKECDMPMMKCNDLVECVFCQNEEEKKDEQVDMPVTKTKEEKEDDSGETKAPRPVKELSQAEIIAKRCRDMKSKGDGDVEAEAELLNMIGTLEMSGDVNETIQEYFLKKKADRTEEKKRNELSAIVEAQDDHMAARTEDKPPPPPADSPKFDSSISCNNNLGDTVFNALKTLFASATVPIDVENVCSRTSSQSNPKDTETKLVNLNKDDWMVSAESCSQCKHLMFTNLNVKGLKRCVMCEPLKMQQSKR